MMTSNLMMKFSRQSWYRTALSVLLIMCMVTSMMIMTVEEAEASTVALAGCVIGGVSLLTCLSILTASGVDVNADNAVQLVNSFWNYLPDTDRVIIDNFESGTLLGDLFGSVSSWLYSVLDGSGNIFFNKDLDTSAVFPIFVESTNQFTDYYVYPESAGYVTGIGFSAYDNINFFGLPVLWDPIDDDSATPYIECLDGSVLYLGGGPGSDVMHLNLFSCYSTPSFVVNSDGNIEVNWQFYDNMWRYSYNYASLIISQNDNRFPAGLFSYLNMVINGDIVSNEYIGVANSFTEYLPTSSDAEKVLTTETPIYVPQTLEQSFEALPSDVRTGTFTGTGGTTDPDNPNDDTDVVGPATGTITGDGTGTGVFEGIGKWLWEIPILAEIYALGQQIRSIVNDGFGISSAISSLVSGIQGTLQSIWTTVTDILSPVTGILTGVQSLVTSVGALASGEVPAELQDRIYQFSGQIFDLLSWDEMSQSMAALENMGSGYGEPPVITLNLHRLVDTAQGIGHFKNTFDNEEVTVIDFEILEDERFQFMGMTIIEWIRLMFTVSMIWYTAWYVWEKIVPDDAVR